MRTISRVSVTIVGFGIAFLGLLGGALYFFSSLFSGGDVDLQRATLGVSIAVLGLGLGLPLAWQGVNSLRGLPSGLFRPRSARLLLTVFALAVILGQAVLTLDILPALAFPPFYVLAAVLPPLFFVVSVGRRLAESDVRWRDVVLQLASGALLATFGALAVEAAFGLLAMVGLSILVGLTSGGADLLQEPLPYLQDPGWLQSPENLAGSLPSLPILVVLGLIVLVIGPMVEEMFKALGVVIMGYRRPVKAQAFLWGLAGGAGFALAEALFNGTTSLDGWMGVAIMRVGATAMHCLGGALMGLGWYYLFTTRRPWRLLGTYAASVSLHTLWNATASGMLAVSLSTASPATNRIGLGLGPLVVVGLMAFLSMLSLTAIFLIFYLARWLRTQVVSERSHASDSGSYAEGVHPYLP